jgi:putative solute:sodium symporter small subunit
MASVRPRGAEQDKSRGEGTAMADNTSSNAYWQANLGLIKWCLVIWALCSFGFGILLRPLLSGISVGGTDLGFWFAQQGSIIVFLILIFFYAWRMNKLDRDYGVEE